MPPHVLTHFKKHDPTLYRVIVSFDDDVRDTPEAARNLFVSLCHTIVGQQLSGKAASAIWGKFRSLFPRKTPAAKHILALSEAKLRESGLSYAKVRSLKDLGERITNRSLQLSKLCNAPEDNVREELLAVRGIGPWSCEMFLMFALGREDVFSPGDLGLQKGIKEIYGLETLPTREYMDKLAQQWAPYRTYASCALWQCVDSA